MLSACPGPVPEPQATAPLGFVPDPLDPETPELLAARERMIEEEVLGAGVDNVSVVKAMTAITREAFLPLELRIRAFDHGAVGRPDGEAVAAPGLTATMLAALELDPDSTVLECGTRSGWLTALLARLAGRVLTTDTRPEAVAGARRVHELLGITNITYRTGDPLSDWPGEGPFDAVVVNGAVPAAPVNLYRTLKPGGRLLVPVGEPGEPQILILSIRGEEAPLSTRGLTTVRFAALAGAN